MNTAWTTESHSARETIALGRRIGRAAQGEETDLGPAGAAVGAGRTRASACSVAVKSSPFPKVRLASSQAILWRIATVLSGVTCATVDSTPGGSSCGPHPATMAPWKRNKVVANFKWNRTAASGKVSVAG